MSLDTARPWWDAGGAMFSVPRIVGPALLSAVALAACGGSGSETGEAEAVSCGTAPAAPVTTLTYEIGDAANESAETICERLDALAIDGEVVTEGEQRVSVTLSSDDARELSPALSSQGLLYVYDLEPNVVPLQKGVELGEVTPQDLEAQETASAFDAAALASKREPAPCDGCSSPAPIFVLFDRRDRSYVAGPAPSEAELLELDEASSVPERDRAVLEIPVGTVVVDDRARSGGDGDPGSKADPHYLVLNDDPTLTGADITDPETDVDPSTGEPVITFGFTEDGQQKFEELTREVAEHGAEAGKPYAIALVFNNAILTRPIIDPATSPDGIDGSNGAQISGGLNSAEAEQLAALLEAGALPAPLKLVGVEDG